RTGTRIGGLEEAIAHPASLAKNAIPVAGRVQASECRCPAGKSRQSVGSPHRAPGIQIHLTHQADLPCPVLTRKIFRLSRRANQRYQLARLTRQEGRLAIVTKRAVRCGGRGCAFDERRVTRTAKSCGPDAPRLRSSFGEGSVN